MRCAPIPTQDLESIVQVAREFENPAMIANREDDLGPGDVQHLRGDTMPPAHAIDEAAIEEGLIGTDVTPDVLLNRAETHLAQALVGTEKYPSKGAHVLPEVASNVTPSISTGRNLTFAELGDLQLDISIELGRAELTIDDVMKLREGSVVTLDKLAGDPVDIVANGRLVARGELIVLQGKFGVRLSEVI